MLVGLGLSALSAKVGGNDNGSGGGSALSPRARAPGACAPIRRRDRALVEKPRPFRIVLRQRNTSVNYGPGEDTVAKEPPHKAPHLISACSSGGVSCTLDDTGTAYSEEARRVETMEVSNTPHRTTNPLYPQPSVCTPTHAAERQPPSTFLCFTLFYS
jgi:hypothetical protein